MLTARDVLNPVEWAKSFTGDGLPPGPSSDFYTGVKQAYDMATGNMATFMNAYHEFGPAFTTRTLGVKIVWLIGAEANQMMYVDNWRDFYWWGKALEGHLAGLIGEGLLASVDDTHDKARRLLDPVFSKTNLKKYVKSMVETTESEVQDLKDGQSFDFYDWVYDLAILNATVCFMGMDADRADARTLHENFDRCVQYYHKPIHLQVLRGPGTPYNSFKKCRNNVSEVLYDEIENRRRSGEAEVDNILDRLILAEEDGETFTDEEVHDQIMNLYWAGHDTTISAVSWLMVMVGKYPSVYEKLQREIDERVGDEPVDVDEVVDGLPYLEMVMDETLRLFPPAWIAVRKSRDAFEMYGETIPEGVNVGFSSLLTHRLPHLWDQPEAFKPERMKPEKKREFPAGAYIPFARGPRTCIGMNFAKYEVKLVVATLLRHFDFDLVPGQNYNGLPIATLTPDGVEISVQRRNGSVRVDEDIRREPVPANPETNGDTTGSADASASGCPVH